MAWMVHLLTACGGVAGLWGLVAAADGRIRTAFLAMLVATAIDAVDGWLARRLDVAGRIPTIDGAKLDDVVDYGTFVVLPAFVLLRLTTPAAAWHWLAAASMLMASAFGFARTDAKTPTAFIGFPSYWNIVVFYLAAAGFPPAWNAAAVVALAAMVFVRVEYVYPTRTPVLRRLTLALAALWAALLTWLVLRYPDVPGAWLALSLIYPAYYLALSVALHRRAR